MCTLSFLSHSDQCDGCETVGKQFNRPLLQIGEEIDGTVEQHYNRPMYEIRGSIEYQFSSITSKLLVQFFSNFVGI